jgi:hypothetical protein
MFGEAQTFGEAQSSRRNAAGATGIAPFASMEYAPSTYPEERIEILFLYAIPYALTVAWKLINHL